MVVVHPDAEFLGDIAGKLKEVCEGITDKVVQLNIKIELFSLFT